MRVTSAPAHLSWRAAETEAIVVAGYGVGALMLAGVAAVHLQQYVALFHGVRWIGPLFLATSVASVLAGFGLAFRRVRQLAALAGVVISVGALAGLVVSYGHGLFGWQEAGFRPPVELAVIAEFGAVIALSIALAASTGASAPTARRGTQ